MVHPQTYPTWSAISTIVGQDSLVSAEGVSGSPQELQRQAELGLRLASGPLDRPRRKGRLSHSTDGYLPLPGTPARANMTVILKDYRISICPPGSE
jgi:hypothetical protein